MYLYTDFFLFSRTIFDVTWPWRGQDRIACPSATIPALLCLNCRREVIFLLPSLQTPSSDPTFYTGNIFSMKSVLKNYSYKHFSSPPVMPSDQPEYYAAYARIYIFYIMVYAVPSAPTSPNNHRITSLLM